jgi:hypothetical protein
MHRQPWLTCMFICLPNLTHSFHTVCKIIRFKVEKKDFFLMLKEYNRVMGPKKPFFRIGIN